MEKTTENECGTIRGDIEAESELMTQEAMRQREILKGETEK